MNYDFHSMCTEQNKKFEKKLESIFKSFVKDYVFALSIINNSEVNERYDEIIESLNQVLYTAAQKARITFQNSAGQIIEILEQNFR